MRPTRGVDRPDGSTRSNEEQDEEATRAVAAAGMLVAQSTVEEPGVTPRPLETASWIARGHLALFEGCKLHLRARSIGSAA
jgi:hypothetical protein